MESANEPTLEQLRLAENLSQDELGAKFGVSDQTISNWETGATYPNLRLDQWILYWQTLKCTPETLRDALARAAVNRQKGGRRKKRSP